MLRPLRVFTILILSGRSGLAIAGGFDCGSIRSFPEGCAAAGSTHCSEHSNDSTTGMQCFEQRGSSRLGGPMRLDNFGAGGGDGAGRGIGRAASFGAYMQGSYAMPPPPLYPRSMMPPPANGIHSGLHRPPATDMRR